MEHRRQIITMKVDSAKTHEETTAILNLILEGWYALQVTPSYVEENARTIRRESLKEFVGSLNRG